jgi:hypothetical protein
MDPFPVRTDWDPSAGRYGCDNPNAVVDGDSVKALCTVTYKASVNASGVVHLTPLPTSTLQFSYPTGPSPDYVLDLPCQYMRGSGLLLGVAPLTSHLRTSTAKALILRRICQP